MGSRYNFVGLDVFGLQLNYLFYSVEREYSLHTCPVPYDDFPFLQETKSEFWHHENNLMLICGGTLEYFS